MKTEELVDLCYRLRAEEAALKAQKLEAEAAVIALGPGEHSGTDLDRVITVVAEAQPGVKYELPEDREADVREIAGEAFTKLFDRITIWKPKGFPDALNLLSGTIRRKILAICSISTSGKKAHVRYN